MEIVINYVREYLKNKTDQEKTQLLDEARLTTEEKNHIKNWLNQNQDQPTHNEKKAIYSLFSYISQK